MEVTTKVAILAENEPQYISITTLDPSQPVPEAYTVKAVVTLLWPYSFSTHNVALSLADSDIRARRSGGQFRLQLEGPVATAVGGSGIGIGDEMVLCLAGAQWVDRNTAIQTPGRSVSSDLLFRHRIYLKLQREGLNIATIDVDQHEALHALNIDPFEPKTPEAETETARCYALPISRYSLAASPLPALIAKAPLSISKRDPFIFDEEDFPELRGKKKFKIGRKSGDWKYVGNSHGEMADENKKQLESDPACDDGTTLGLTSNLDQISTRATLFRRASLRYYDLAKEQDHSSACGFEAVPTYNHPFDHRLRLDAIDGREQTRNDFCFLRLPSLDPLASHAPLTVPRSPKLFPSIIQDIMPISPLKDMSKTTTQDSSVDIVVPGVYAAEDIGTGRFENKSRMDHNLSKIYLVGPRTQDAENSNETSKLPPHCEDYVSQQEDKYLTEDGSQPSNLDGAFESRPLLESRPVIDGALLGMQPRPLVSPERFAVHQTASPSSSPTRRLTSPPLRREHISPVPNHSPPSHSAPLHDISMLAGSSEAPPEASRRFSKQSVLIEFAANSEALGSRNVNHTKDWDTNIGQLQPETSIGQSLAKVGNMSHGSGGGMSPHNVADTFNAPLYTPTAEVLQISSAFLVSETASTAGQVTSVVEDIKQHVNLMQDSLVLESSQDAATGDSAFSSLLVKSDQHIEMNLTPSRSSANDECHENYDRQTTPSQFLRSVQTADLGPVLLRSSVAPMNIKTPEIDTLPLPASASEASDFHYIEQQDTPAQEASNIQADYESASVPESVSIHELGTSHDQKRPYTPHIDVSPLPTSAIAASDVHAIEQQNIPAQEAAKMQVVSKSASVLETVLETKLSAAHGQKSRLSRSRVNLVPDVISPWFVAKWKEYESTPSHKGPLANEAEEVSVMRLSVGKSDVKSVYPVIGAIDSALLENNFLQRVPAHDRGAHLTRPNSAQRIEEHVASTLFGGLRTALSYFSPLSSLPLHLNDPKSSNSTGVDVLAIVVTATAQPKRAKGGPKDHFTTLYVADPPFDSKGSQIQIFRPWKRSLPIAEIGDVILLRNFVPQSRARECFLLSSDASAWAVWRFSGNNAKSDGDQTADEDYYKNIRECRGPPVESGAEEEAYAAHLRRLWLYGNRRGK